MSRTAGIALIGLEGFPSSLIRNNDSKIAPTSTRNTMKPVVSPTIFFFFFFFFVSFFFSSDSSSEAVFFSSGSKITIFSFFRSSSRQVTRSSYIAAAVGYRYMRFLTVALRMMLSMDCGISGLKSRTLGICSRKCFNATCTGASP